jgi:hypothetical protein
MKKVLTLGMVALLMAASAGFSGYGVTRNADTPECCKNKEACCPGSSCCPGGQHGSNHCRLRT